MWTRALLKENAKVAFKRNYWSCVAVSAIAGLMGVYAGGPSFRFEFEQETEAGQTTFSSIPEYLIYVMGAATLIAIIMSICISILLTNVVRIGCSRYFLENREHQTNVGQLFYGFKNGRYGSNVYTMFMMDLSIVLHTLLFLIPGIIKSYAYALVPYILAENPDLDKDRVLELSRDMMDGHKLELFILEWSFIGWGLLNTITMGFVGIFWMNPYLHATKAEFYTAMKAEAVALQILRPGELPGIYYQEQTVEW